MQHRLSVLERAFELAREGKTLAEIRKTLRTEGYENAAAQLYGPTLIASLKRARPVGSPSAVESLAQH